MWQTSRFLPRFLSKMFVVDADELSDWIGLQPLLFCLHDCELKNDGSVLRVMRGTAGELRVVGGSMEQ